MTDVKPQHDLRRVHPLASVAPVMNFIDPSAKLGARVVVWHFAVVMADVVLADDVSIGSRAEIGRGSTICRGARISSGVFLPYSSFVGCDVFIGPNATFTDDRYPRVLAPGEHYKAEPPRIGDGASIGAGAVILPGVHIGSGALIGAGAVVTRDVPADAHVRGEPARRQALSIAAG